MHTATSADAPRPRRAVQPATWAAIACRAIIGFLAGVAVLYGVTPTNAMRGGPPGTALIQ